MGSFLMGMQQNWDVASDSQPATVQWSLIQGDSIFYKMRFNVGATASREGGSPHPRRWLP